MKSPRKSPAGKKFLSEPGGIRLVLDGHTSERRIRKAY